MSADWRRYFRELWPSDGRRGEVLRQYAALGQLKHALADIALRNGVFRPNLEASNLYQAGIAEGRRQAALEIFQLASMAPDQLWTIVEKKPSERTS